METRIQTITLTPAMKPKKWTSSVVITATVVACAVQPLLAQNGNSNTAAKIPASPVGLFSASPTIVQTGTNPTLTWSILYPSTVSNVATITPPGSITMTAPMYISVRPVGVGVTGSRSGADLDKIYAETRISLNGSAYDQLFYGVGTDVDPAYSLYIKKLKAGDTINFAGRYVEGGNWTPLYTTRSANQQVISLVDGDSIPVNFNLNETGKVAQYLKPYLDGAGKVKVGPLSVLVLMELAQTDHNNGAYDYQDAALLVSFASRHPNNGHGNNLDGVDSSNPGKGSGGPNGAVDPSGGVDDEAR